jgi:hypothetical protein
MAADGGGVRLAVGRRVEGQVRAGVRHAQQHERLDVGCTRWANGDPLGGHAPFSSAP